MTEDHIDELADETRTDRRSILKSLGAMGFAVPGGETTDVGTAVPGLSRDGTGSLAAAGAPDFFTLGRGWLLRHDDYIMEPWEPEPHDPKFDLDPELDEIFATAQTQHSIKYVDVQWQDYGSPVGDGGCWKHTFFLTSFASTTAIGYESDPVDGIDHADLETGEAQGYAEISEAALELDTNERGDGTNDYGDLPDGWPDAENIGVGVRRDEELVGFFEDIFDRDEDVTVDYDREDGSTVEMGLTKLLAKPPVDESTDDDRPLDEAPTQDGEEIEQRWGSIDESNFDTRAFGLGMWMVGMAASALCGACAVVVGLVGTALSVLTQGEYDPEVEFDQGVRFEWTPDDGDPVAFSGHYMMFDVFVPPADPGRDRPMGTFTVQSQYDVAGLPAPGADLTDGYFEFNPTPRWEFRVDPLPHPDDLEDDSRDERFTIEPRRDSASDVTNVVAEPIDIETVLPDAVFTHDPFCPEPGDPLSFDATASWSSDEAQYRWEITDALDDEVVATPTGETVELEDGLEEGWYGVVLRIEDDGNGTVDDMNRLLYVGAHDPEECLGGEDGVTVEDDIQTLENHWANEEGLQGTASDDTETETLQRINAEFNETHDLYRDGTPWGVQ